MAKKCILIVLLALVMIFGACSSGANNDPPAVTPGDGVMDEIDDNESAGSTVDDPVESGDQAENSDPADVQAENSGSSYVPKDHGYGKIASFSTRDLGGAEVTQAIFGEKPATFINYWATWCGPCRVELPDFPGMYEKYKDRVTFVTIVDDGENNDSAMTLAAQYLGGYINLLPTDDLVAPIQTGYVPTSVIVDAEGFLVIERIIGAVGDYSDFIDAVLEIVE